VLYQYIEYLPFGEIMVEHNNSNYDNVYKFNGKELDESTGYYYYAPVDSASSTSDKQRAAMASLLAD
jgi:hypothetical protein